MSKLDTMLKGDGKGDGWRQVLEAVRITSVPAEARADLVLFAADSIGLDLRPALVEVIKEADEGRKLRAQAEEAERHPLSPEIFLGRIETQGRLFAAVTNGPSDTYVPCRAQEIEGLEEGDRVLLDLKDMRLAGRDGLLARPGDIVSVQNLPTGLVGQVVVRHHDLDVLARVPKRLSGNGTLQPGNRVVYDPLRRFVYQVIDTHGDGTELLVELSALDQVRRADLGAPHPILDRMLFRVKMWVQYFDWVQRMRVRPRMTYLLVGPTGSGKTMHLKVLAREITDFVEELTGQRVSRLVICDASTFYSPWFGETESRISQWFQQLKRLGATKLRTRDGREITVPLIVVLEEVEALFRGRGEPGGSSHLFDRPLALILQMMSSVANELNIPILFCSTTNRPDLLDAAARRRLGVRQVFLGTLAAAQAASVLDKKVPPDLPVRSIHQVSPEQARQSVINQVLSYLYGNDPDQGLAEVQFVNSDRRTLSRRDLVTGAVLEDAVSTASDDCLQQSADAGDLLGLDGEAMVRYLQAHFESLAMTLRPHNIREYCPEWFADEAMQVASVRPLVRRARRPRSLFVR